MEIVGIKPYLQEEDITLHSTSYALHVDFKEVSTECYPHFKVDESLTTQRGSAVL